MVQPINATRRHLAGVILRSRKRKRATLDDGVEANPRSQPRPRLQDTHQISDLQKINRHPSILRKSLETLSTEFSLPVNQLLRDLQRHPYFSSLPFTVDEFTYFDAWVALRVQLHSPIRNPKIKMQRVRAKPANPKQAAQQDPVFYTTEEGTLTSSATLYGAFIPAPVNNITIHHTNRLFDRTSLYVLSSDANHIGTTPTTLGVRAPVLQVTTGAMRNDWTVRG
jgi:hypothetical protein